MHTKSINVDKASLSTEVMKGAGERVAIVLQIDVLSVDNREN
jgi:hypothetical protein